MRADEVKIADAVAALRVRLEGWGVEDADEKAATYVRDMLWNGWRPRALPVHDQTPASAGCPPPREYRRARDQLQKVAGA